MKLLPVLAVLLLAVCQIFAQEDNQGPGPSAGPTTMGPPETPGPPGGPMEPMEGGAATMSGAFGVLSAACLAALIAGRGMIRQ